MAAVVSVVSVSPHACTQAVKDALSQTFGVFEVLPGCGSQHFEPWHPVPIAASSTASKKETRTGDRRIEDLLES